MALFSYDPALLAVFPTIRAGVIHAGGLVNGPSPVDLLQAFETEQRATIAGIDICGVGGYAPEASLGHRVDILPGENRLP